MKKAMFYLAGIILFMTVAILNNIERKSYMINYENIQGLMMETHYQSVFSFMFVINGNLPTSTESLIKDGSDSIYFSNILLDPLNKNRKKVQYVPIYNRLNNLREGFLILSSGVDGRINHNINDSIFWDNFVEKLDVYNPSMLEQEFGVINYDTTDYYSFAKRFFGKKDYLVCKVNCVEDYIRGSVLIKDTREIINWSRSRPYRFGGNIQRINDDTLKVDLNATRISCIFNSNAQLNNLKGKYVVIVGKFNGIGENGNVVFDNCWILTSSTVE